MPDVRTFSFRTAPGPSRRAQTPFCAPQQSVPSGAVARPRRALRSSLQRSRSSLPRKIRGHNSGIMGSILRRLQWCVQRLGFVSPFVGSSSIAAAEPQTEKSTARFPLATHMNSPLHAARCGHGQQIFLLKISMFPGVVALLLLWRHARADPRLSCDGQRRPRCLGCAQPAPPHRQECGQTTGKEEVGSTNECS